MKKIICTLATFLFTASLFSCGSGNNEPSSKADETTTIASTEASTVTTTSTITTTATTSTTAITTTTEIVTTIAETEPPAINSISTSQEYVEEIDKILSLDSTQDKIGSMIGAIDGYSFKYQDLSFEIYKYETGARELSDGVSGTITLTVEGFGDFTRSSVVNGNYLMIFEEANDDVINAFKSINV